MSIRTTRGTGYSVAAPTESQLLVRHKRTPLNGTAPAIICMHSHGGDVSQYHPGVPTIADPGWHVWMLAQAGYLVLAVDHGGVATWSNATTMSRVDDAYTYVMNLGAKSGKVGVMGWSMGGLTALNWIKRNPTKISCAWIWSPVSDLTWARSNVTWGPEITTAYPSGSAGYNVADEPASWRGIAPMKIAHATDDTVVPSTQTDTFVAAVNDPLVSKRTVQTGGHIALFEQVPESETTKFYKTYL